MGSRTLIAIKESKSMNPKKYLRTKDMSAAEQPEPKYKNTQKAVGSKKKVAVKKNKAKKARRNNR